MRIVDPHVAIAMLHREVPTTSQPFHQQASTFSSGISSKIYNIQQRILSVECLVG